MASLQCAAGRQLRHSRAVVVRRMGRNVPASQGDDAAARLCMKKTSLAASLLLLLVALLCPVVVERSVWAHHNVQSEDKFFETELGNAAYPEEKRFLEIQKQTGDKTLYSPDGTFFMYTNSAPPQAQMDLARELLKQAGEPTDVVDRGAERLASLSEKYAVLHDGGGKNGEVSEEEWVNIAGTGSVWNMDSFRTFCPEIRRIAVVRMRGISRIFRLPSSICLTFGVSSAEKKDLAVITNDILSDDDIEREKKAPIGTVLRMPPYCFARFAWREKVYDLLPMDVDVVEEDEEKQTLVETGKKLRAYVPVSSTNERLEWRIGYARFHEIVEQRAHNPQRALQDFLDVELQHMIKDSCLEKVPKSSHEEWSLRRCFFEMNRDTLYGFLGHQQWDARWGKTLGLAGLQSTWAKGVEMYPNPVYLRLCLCGAAKESVSVAKDMATTSFLYDDKTTVKDWLLSGKGSLEIADDKRLPEAYAMARDCSAKELVDLLRDNSDKRRLRGNDVVETPQDLTPAAA